MSVGDSYEAWPQILQADNGDLLCIYNDGTQHQYSGNRVVRQQRSTDAGRTWAAATTIINTAEDDATFGIGKTPGGDLLAWVRHEDSGGTYTHTCYASTDDGATWSSRCSMSFSPNPVLMSLIEYIPTVGLMCWWHAEVESGESENSYGYLISDDDGVTWTQTTLATGVGTNAWPSEVILQYLGDGNIFGMGRSEAAAASTKLFQITSEDYGTSWSVVETNITDQFRTRAAVEVRDDEVRIYYWHRNYGILRRRTASLASIWSSPTSWPASEVVGASGYLTDADTGYPDTVQLGDEELVVYYAGDAANCKIYTTQPAAP